MSYLTAGLRLLTLDTTRFLALIGVQFLIAAAASHFLGRYFYFIPSAVALVMRQSLGTSCVEEEDDECSSDAGSDLGSPPSTLRCVPLYSHYDPSPIARSRRHPAPHAYYLDSSSLSLDYNSPWALSPWAPSSAAALADPGVEAAFRTRYSPVNIRHTIQPQSQPQRLRWSDSSHSSLDSNSVDSCEASVARLEQWSTRRKRAVVPECRCDEAGSGRWATTISLHKLGSLPTRMSNVSPPMPIVQHPNAPSVASTTRPMLHFQSTPSPIRATLPATISSRTWPAAPIPTPLPLQMPIPKVPSANIRNAGIPGARPTVAAADFLASRTQDVVPMEDIEETSYPPWMKPTRTMMHTFGVDGWTGHEVAMDIDVEMEVDVDFVVPASTRAPSLMNVDVDPTPIPTSGQVQPASATRPPARAPSLMSVDVDPVVAPAHPAPASHPPQSVPIPIPVADTGPTPKPHKSAPTLIQVSAPAGNASNSNSCESLNNLMKGTVLSDSNSASQQTVGQVAPAVLTAKPPVSTPTPTNVAKPDVDKPKPGVDSADSNSCGSLSDLTKASSASTGQQPDGEASTSTPTRNEVDTASGPAHPTPAFAVHPVKPLTAVPTLIHVPDSQADASDSDSSDSHHEFEPGVDFEFREARPRLQADSGSGSGAHSESNSDPQVALESPSQPEPECQPAPEAQVNEFLQSLEAILLLQEQQKQEAEERNRREAEWLKRERQELEDELVRDLLG